MTKTISVKIHEGDLLEAERSAKRRGMSRNAYINHALKLMNRVDARNKLKGELVAESALVRKDSMSVLADFEALYGEEP
ncbi:MAG: hypothetical protein HY925_11310 [Elusimicrobia bacterium]|nr:hypothetical protein [Elusimicrobiota bacterium]